MNLTLPVVLAIAGVILVVIGVIGRIRIKEAEVGSESVPARIIIFILGAGLLIGAYFVHQSDRPDLIKVKDNLNAEAGPTPSTPAPPEVTIKTPSPNETLNVETEDRAAKIPVTGTLKGVSDLSNIRIYVFTNSGGVSEWWYDEPANPEQNGNWSANALVGSHEQPVKPNQTVRIRAVAANDSDIQAATKNGGKKMVKDFSSFGSAMMSNELTVTVVPRQSR